MRSLIVQFDTEKGTNFPPRSIYKLSGILVKLLLVWKLLILFVRAVHNLN